MAGGLAERNLENAPAARLESRDRGMLSFIRVYLRSSAANSEF
jgi:hypothetical protein